MFLSALYLFDKKEFALPSKVFSVQTMSRIEALKTEAMSLTDSDRANLASELLYSLPATLQDEDDGLAEALRRDQEMDIDPSCSITWDELKKSVGR